MTTHGGEAADVPGGASERPLSFGVSVDELRARFQAQGRPGLVGSRRREARQTGRLYGTFAGLAAAICLVLVVVHLGRDGVMGIWGATYAVGMVACVAEGVPAWNGRTRWAMAVVCVAAAMASLGDSPAFR